jgi:hypothetical protein
MSSDIWNEKQVHSTPLQYASLLMNKKTGSVYSAS